MIILIPLGGLGKRFKDGGYIEPKALIKVNSKPILYWLLDNLDYKIVDFIYIPYHREYVEYNLEEQLQTDYPDYHFRFLIIDYDTRGAAETISIALENLIESSDNPKIQDKPILCLDSDNFYTNYNIISNWNGENCVFVFRDTQSHPIFSYITEENEIITDIAEKEKISDLACTGAYGFDSFMALRNYCQYIITNNIQQKNEFYTSVVIKEMLNQSIRFSMREIQNKYYFSLGTPNQISIFKYYFLFDLDGTLVNTDSIYLQVWYELLLQYNLNIDDSFYKNFIQGNSDVTFLKFLIPDISPEELDHISNQKDQKFIEYLQEHQTDILLPGVMDFFQQINNGHIAIVTSSNRKTAEYILKYTSLDQYIQVLISANECQHHKPHPEPYKKALLQLNGYPEFSIIFEDSISGYISAKKSEVNQICLICHENSDSDIKKSSEVKIKNFLNLDVNNLINHKKKPEIPICNYLETITKKLKENLPIKDIRYKNVNLKTGYICDIDCYQVIYNNKQSEDIILKISNLDNELSKTAVKLNMYHNESYFYEHISHLITDNIKIPKNFGIIRIDGKDGILLEDLHRYSGKFNIDLNNNITLLLLIIKEIHSIHNKFYFQKKEEIIEVMKPLLSVNKIGYYHELIKSRFEKFLTKNNFLISSHIKKILTQIYQKFSFISDYLSSFPLSFCHGDLKSPNIFYQNNRQPYFLDWQYIHLNKGVSDIVFLLVESIEFEPNIVTIAEKYYYQLICEKRSDYSYDQYLIEFKLSLCFFPFFVCVWFNSEDNSKLLDKIFPIKFMKNMLKYYDFYLDINFLNTL